LQNGAIQTATPFAILMCLMSWCLYKTHQRDYREEREQVQEIMAHDQNVEKRQLQEIMRRHESGEPVGTLSSNSND
jgi:choline-glycine betaine transporter